MQIRIAANGAGTAILRLVLVFNNSEINNLIKESLDRFIERYGHNAIYAYGIVNKTDLARTIVISNYDKWYNGYAARQLQNVDPVVHMAIRKNTDFYWNNEKLLSMGYTLPFFYTDAAQAGITDGRTFMLHDYTGMYMATLTIMSLGDSAALDSRLVNDRNAIQMLLNETHTLLLKMYSVIYTKKTSGQLTRREREVLYLVSIGNEYSEVAELLNIKEGTVRFHLTNINEKLAARNVRHAIRIAMESRLIETIT